MATLSIGLVEVGPPTPVLSVGVVEVVAATAPTLSVGVVELDATPPVIPDSGLWLRVGDAWRPTVLWLDVP